MKEEIGRGDGWLDRSSASATLKGIVCDKGSAYLEVKAQG